MGLKIGTNGTGPEAQWVNVYYDEVGGYVWWMDHEPAMSDDGEPDARLKVATSNNPDARAFGRKQARKYRHIARRGNGLPDKIAFKILREQYAHTVLLDWEGVEFPDGETPDYTPKRGIEAFEADREFLDLVTEIANETQAFKNAALQEASENLGNASAGRSSGDPMSPSLSVQGST